MGGMNEVYRECLKCASLRVQTSLTYLISPKWGGKASPLILPLYLVRTFSVTKYFCFILPASSLPAAMDRPGAIIWNQCSLQCVVNIGLSRPYGRPEDCCSDPADGTRSRLHDPEPFSSRYCMNSA